MLLEQCPHCNVRHVYTSFHYSSALHAQNNSVQWSLVRCQNTTCQGLVLVELNDGVIGRVYPFVAHDLDRAAELPMEVRDDFWEAAMCLGAGCYKASLVMSRRVLQRCLKTQGCTQHNLVDAIKHAVESGILRSAFHAVANEIREYGNLGAHPDDDQLQNASRESAQQVLEFTRLLIHEVYEVPLAAARLRRNREAPTTA